MAEGDTVVRGSDPASDRQDFYGRIRTENMAPLWESLHLLVPPQPNSPVLPAKWDYDGVVRPFIMESGKLISAQEAERRVLMLENPGLGGRSAITQSLYAGLQMILPGEVAPAHRHTQSALRFIIEGQGAYTAINGEKAIMSPGDLVLTPSWNWHDHGNETDQPMVWLDGLDIPLVAFFDVGFAEAANAERQALARPPGDSDLRYGANMAPVDWKPQSKASPVFNYPYERTLEVLETLRRNGEPDPYHGYKMRYVNPASGGHVMPTMGAFIQRLEAGTTTAPYRSTDGTIYVVVEGTGLSKIGGVSFPWKPRDIIVAPSWAQQTHRADSDAVLFSFSDRPVQEAIGLWREERG
ncbi:MAG TPA: gentisate 1,2-dioxygenase [Caulobacteraceae bacterium]|jgi:gentisate 1,2-dioxygenase|nr:gentisate 1,2-dioxygenase [Caulobacteraceae bacterium]